MLFLFGYCEMGSRQSKSPQIPPKPNAYLRFDDFEVFRAIGRGAFGKVSNIVKLRKFINVRYTFFVKSQHS